jgi:tetratricopeptide (TPR) repeat protein
MALGFGFNKAKVLAAAEKYVQQGKLQNAINEYEKVIEKDPRDLTVTNTVGDLYARLGQADRATACFKRVGERYAEDGFTVKAIAMFKKLTKVNPSALDAVLKLADLYTQQGLYNDARQQYMTVADHCLRSNNLTGAAAVFQKMLQLDPENVAAQSKLADLYIQMGKRDEAKEIYFRAADSLHMRGALDAADEALGKVIRLEPGNSRALLTRAQLSFEQGDVATTIRHLQQVPKLEANPDGLALLLRAFMQAGQRADAEKVARTLASAHKDLSGIQVIAESAVTGGAFDKALALYQEFSDQLGKDTMARGLEQALSKAKADVPTLEGLRGLFEKLGDQTHVLESTEWLAHALVKAGDLKRARDLYDQLQQLEPENPQHQQHYRQVLAKLGEDAAVRPLAPHEAVQAFVVDELAMSAPTVEQQYPPDVQEAIKAALTDSELMSSYNLPDKALAPLEKVRPLAPRDAQVNQRLASLYAVARRYADAAACCDILQEVYELSGHALESKQYAELAEKYHAAAAEAEGPEAAAGIETAEFAIPPAAEIAAAAAAAPASAEAPAEIDISDEWATAFEAPAAAEAPPAEAAAAPAVATEFAQAIEAARQAAEAQPSAPEIVAAAPAIEIPVEIPAEPAAAAAGGVLGEFVAGLEESLGGDFAIAAPPAPMAAAAAVPAPAPSAAPAAPSAEASLLADMFEEFREEAEAGVEKEDPETHYNLGIAFREMGLLDEAIGELQKVYQAMDKGAAFDQAMQVYTLLAQCFVDKGVPEASVKWYEKALKIATDEEQRMALHYDMASAYEAGGNKQAALQHFTEVYGSNIDYRDVAERIKALKS